MHFLLQRDDYIRVWQYASIQIRDIKKYDIPPYTKLPAALLHHSGFICIHLGTAQLLLDNHIYSVHHSHIIHYGKNNWLEYQTGKEGLTYTLLSYEVDFPSHTPSDVMDLIEQASPFQAVYDFIPEHPFLFHDILEQMYILSVQNKQMSQFEAKVLFYRWLEQIFNHYPAQEAIPAKTSPVQLVIGTLEYMLHHYASPLTLDQLAIVMNCSPGHLSNRFKQILDRGPIDCLIHLRMNKAVKLLLQTDMPLRSIASAIGYQDAYYFSKAFKKHTGISPSSFRKQNMKFPDEDVTSNEGRNDIVDYKSSCYIDDDNHYQQDRLDGGSDFMFKNKWLIPVSLLVAFGFILGACGTQANPKNNAPAVNETAQSPSTPEATTRIVKTSQGDIEIPTNPTRIVTDYYVGNLLAIGVKPVGSLGLYMQSPYLSNQIEGITDIGDNIETIIELEPDLIITGDAEKYDSYAKIAPAVLIKFEGDVRSDTHKIAEVLGKEDAANVWEQQFDKQNNEAKARLSKIVKEGETVTVFAGGIQKTLTIYGNGYTGQSIHGELGLPMQVNVLKAIDPKQPWINISNEVLADYAGDYIFVAVDLKTESYNYAKEPIWSGLEAVKQNKLFEIDGYRYWFSDPISIQGQVQDIVNMMEERLAGK